MERLRHLDGRLRSVYWQWVSSAAGRSTCCCFHVGSCWNVLRRVRIRALVMILRALLHNVNAVCHQARFDPTGDEPDGCDARMSSLLYHPPASAFVMTHPHTALPQLHSLLRCATRNILSYGGWHTHASVPARAAGHRLSRHVLSWQTDNHICTDCTVLRLTTRPVGPLTHRAMLYCWAGCVVH